MQALCGKDPMALLQTLVPMEKWKRDALGSVLTEWLELTENALLCRSGQDTVSPLARALADARSSPELHCVIAELQKVCLYLQSNVSPAAVCGYLEWKLRL